jgi:hypothetical protein
VWSWIWIGVLYVLGIGFFRWLGGLNAAATAIQRWGHATGEKRRRAGAAQAPHPHDEDPLLR